MQAPWFDHRLLHPEAIQKSGRGMWFSLDAYQVEVGEHLKQLAIPSLRGTVEADYWLLLPRTVLNLGTASSMGVIGWGGGTQAELLFSSPEPRPLSYREVRRYVTM